MLWVVGYKQKSWLETKVFFLPSYIFPPPVRSVAFSLPLRPCRPQEDVTSFPEVCGKNPKLQLGEKKRGALERPSVQRSAFSEVTLVGRGSFHVLTQFAREGIPKACSGLWLRDFFFFFNVQKQGCWSTFFGPLPLSPSNSQTPGAPEPPTPGKSRLSFSD